MATAKQIGKIQSTSQRVAQQINKSSGFIN